MMSDFHGNLVKQLILDRIRLCQQLRQTILQSDDDDDNYLFYYFRICLFNLINLMSIQSLLYILF